MKRIAVSLVHNASAACTWDRSWSVVAAIALTACSSAPALAATATMLTPADIKATFATGKSFTATSVGGTAFSFTFNPDGSAVQVSKGQSVTNGAWRLSDNGYCSKWGSGSENCYTVEKNGTRYDVRDTAGHVVSRWTLATTSVQVSPPLASAPTPAAPPLPPSSLALLTVTPTRPTTAAPPPPAPLKAAVGQFRDGTYTGSSADAYYGTVQVRAVVTSGRLVSIDVLDYPSDRSTSRQINNYALPQLQREVVQAQGVHVKIVSGATLTSDAYVNSLRGALQQAQ